MNDLTGKLIGVYIGTRKGAGKTVIESAELIAGHGIRGDRHAGQDADRQVSFFARELLETLQREGFNVSAEAISANFLTENISLNSLIPGTRLQIGAAVIELSEARVPCRNITRIDKRLPKRLYGNCGMMGRILIGGIVHPGSTIAILTILPVKPPNLFAGI